MDIVNPAVTRYLDELAAVDDEPVLVEMEKLAESKGFPIVGRLCGKTLELLALSVRAQRIFEMGSGYGYSAYWFSRATGPHGEIHLTDTDGENAKKAMDFLGRAMLDGPIDFHVESAFDAFDKTTGEFDIVYCDIDKGDYPDAWRKARDRIRIGGLFICDNMLWSGRVTDDPAAPDDVKEGWTEAIDATNHMIANDRHYRSIIVPLRDGLVVAVRVS